MVCITVWEDNPRILVSELSSVQTHKLYTNFLDGKHDFERLDLKSWNIKNICNNVTEYVTLLYGPRREKPCLQLFANKKSADRSAHPFRLISTFVISLLESFISKLQYSS